MVAVFLDWLEIPTNYLHRFPLSFTPSTSLPANAIFFFNSKYTCLQRLRAHSPARPMKKINTAASFIRKQLVCQEHNPILHLASLPLVLQ